MKSEYIEWFINKSAELANSHSHLKYVGKYEKSIGVYYEYINIHKNLVPFHNDLFNYITSLDDITKQTNYDMYHIHYWNEGNYFVEHVDDNFNRKWAYVCELKPSECNTHLLVNGFPFLEGIFDSQTKHEVPKIKKGKRISLTVFGTPIKTII